jgi:hypothetical protein
MVADACHSDHHNVADADHSQITTFGVSFILGILVVGIIFTLVTGHPPALSDALWIGPIAFLLVAPLFDVIICSYRSKKLVLLGAAPKWSFLTAAIVSFFEWGLVVAILYSGALLGLVELLGPPNTEKVSLTREAMMRCAPAIAVGLGLIGAFCTRRAPSVSWRRRLGQVGIGVLLSVTSVIALADAMGVHDLGLVVFIAVSSGSLGLVALLWAHFTKHYGDRASIFSAIAAIFGSLKGGS